MNNEFEILQELQGVIKNAANTVSRLMEIKKEREAKTTELKRENDFEIECIVHGNKNYWRRQDGLYNSDLFVGGSGKDWLLNNGGYIFQVTRKSDGVVFSVGDKIMVHRNSGYYGQRTIERFELKDGIMKEVDELGESRLDQISKPLHRTPLPSPDSLSKRILYLEERVDYIEKVLKIEG